MPPGDYVSINPMFEKMPETGTNSSSWDGPASHIPTISRGPGELPQTPSGKISSYNSKRLMKPTAQLSGFINMAHLTYPVMVSTIT